MQRVSPTDDDGGMVAKLDSIPFSSASAQSAPELRDLSASRATAEVAPTTTGAVSASQSPEAGAVEAPLGAVADRDLAIAESIRAESISIDQAYELLVDEALRSQGIDSDSLTASAQIRVDLDALLAADPTIVGLLAP